MTEPWAVDELTEEQESEMAEEAAEASEEEAPALNPNIAEDGEDPPQIDRSTPSERFATEEQTVAAPEKETETAEEKPEEGEKTSEVAEEPETKEVKRPGWWNKVPAEAQDYIDNLHGARKEARETKREAQEEFDRRSKMYAETLGEKFAETIKGQQPVVKTEAPIAPDPDEDPDGFREFYEAKDRDLEARETKLQEQESSNAELGKLQQNIMSQEAAFRVDNPDYDTVISTGKAAAIAGLASQYEISKIPDAMSKASDEINRRLWSKAEELNGQGGDFAAWVYHYAGQYIPSENGEKSAETKTSTGEETAAAIIAGEKSSKALGKSGANTSTGELTLEDISNIRDADEHDKAYRAWEDAQIGHSSEWRP